MVDLTSIAITKPLHLKEDIRLGVSDDIVFDQDGFSYLIKEGKPYIDDEEDISDEQDLTFKAFSRVLEDNEMKLTVRMMNTLGMKSRSGEYTNLAFLMSDQSDIVVKLAEYDSDMNFRIKKSFKGSLVKILSDVEEQTERLNDVKVVIDGSSFNYSSL